MTFTNEGRTICKDGSPLFDITRLDDGYGHKPLSPYETDRYVDLIVKMLNEVNVDAYMTMRRRELVGEVR